MQFNETTYHSLLALAENYREANPPRIRLCLHCLLSVFNMNPPPPVQIRTHIQVGSLLIKHTENKQLAESHLNAAILLSKQTGNHLSFFESVSLLSTVLCQMSKLDHAKPILREGIAASQQNAYWHARLILQLAHIHHEEGDHASTLQLLDVGAELASTHGSDYLKILFLLSKGMVLLVQQKLEEVNVVLSMCGQLIDGIKNSSPMQVESHKVYFLTLQVAHLLQGGQVKSVKSSLKQLQQSIQEISSLPPSSCSLVPQINAGKEANELEELTKQLTTVDAFSWLPRDHMCILVYLVTVTYSLLAGYLDKAQKYTEKALKQIRKLKTTDSSPLLVRLELMFLEHMSQCHLIMCDKKAALQKIMEGCRLCVTFPDDRLVVRHTTQMHTLLGMYCMSMNYMDDAEKHLQIATKNSLGNEQLATNMLNLAMVHVHNFQLNNGRISQANHQELVHILNQISPDSIALKSRSLKAASYFVKGMFAFVQSIHNDAKRFLRETLKMSNAQDLNRLTACALVLLGHIYSTVGNNQESINVVLPAMQLANKIPDTSVKLWASALLRDLYRLCGDEEHFNEYKKMYEKLASRLLSEQYTASESSQHELIKWFTDELPPVEVMDVTESPADGQQKLVMSNDGVSSDLGKAVAKEGSGSTLVMVKEKIKLQQLQAMPSDLSAARSMQSGASLGLNNSRNMNCDTLMPPLAVQKDRTSSTAFYPQKATSFRNDNQRTDVTKSHQNHHSSEHGIVRPSGQSSLTPFISNLDTSNIACPTYNFLEKPYLKHAEDIGLAMTDSQLRDRMQQHSTLSNQIPQASWGFTLGHPQQQSHTQGALGGIKLDNVSKPSRPDPSTYLIGAPSQGLSVEGYSSLQQQQFQMLQQLEHAGNMHTAYQHTDPSADYPIGQTLGYQANTESLGSTQQQQQQQQQQIWPSNRTNFHNISNSGYNWK